MKTDCFLLQVCEEQLCEEQIFPLAINCMDRFLCVCKIKRQQLQLLGATCLLIASKIRSSNILTIELLCAYTDYSVTYNHIRVSAYSLKSTLKVVWAQKALLFYVT